MNSPPTMTGKFVARAALFREILKASLPVKVATGFFLVLILLVLLMIPAHWGLVVPAQWVERTPGRCFWGNMENRVCWRVYPKQNSQKTPKEHHPPR